MRESKGEECDMALKNNIEGIIIKWGYQVPTTYTYLLSSLCRTDAQSTENFLETFYYKPTQIFQSAAFFPSFYSSRHIFNTLASKKRDAIYITFCPQ